MTRSEKLTVLVVCAVALAVAYSAGRRNANTSAEAKVTRVWQDSLKRVRQVVRVDSVQVVNQVRVVRTLRDTLRLRLSDTVAVDRFIRSTDTLIERCLACVASASDLGRISDTVIVRVGANRRRWWDRVGISAGYGFLLDKNGSVRHGAVLGVSVKIWP